MKNVLSLREYQRDLKRRLEAHLLNGVNVIGQLPTGAGKTVLGAEIIRSWKGRVIVAAHRNYLLTQWRCYIPCETTTIQKAIHNKNPWKGYSDTDLLILDEAHHETPKNTWGSTVMAFPGVRLGLTATPERTNPLEGLADMWGALECGPSKDDLIDGNYLLPLDVKPVRDLLVGTKVNSSGEYTIEGIQGADEQSVESATHTALSLWRQNGGSANSIFYCVNVEHAQLVQEKLIETGYKSKCVVGATPEEERKKIFKEFIQDKNGPLTSCAVLTEGLDLPNCKQVVVLRPTKSDILWLQICGRAQRPFNSKSHGLVTDFTDNHRRLLHPDYDRVWSLKPYRETEKLLGIGDGIGIYECDACVAPVHPNSWECKMCLYRPICPRCKTQPIRPYGYNPMCLSCFEIHYYSDLKNLLEEERHSTWWTQRRWDLKTMCDQDPFLRNMLEEERSRISRAADDRKAEIRRSVDQMEADLEDDECMYIRFEQYRDSLADDQRPSSRRQEAKLYTEWENRQETEFKSWQEELARLEAQTVDWRLVFSNVEERLLRLMWLLEAEDREADLVQGVSIDTEPVQQSLRSSTAEPQDSGEWVNFVELAQKMAADTKPGIFRDPRGNETSVTSWDGLLWETAEWFVREGLLTKEKCPVLVGGMQAKCLINSERMHPNGMWFKRAVRLSRGLYLEAQLPSREIAWRSAQLVEKLGEDPNRFHVQVYQRRRYAR